MPPAAPSSPPFARRSYRRELRSRRSPGHHDTALHVASHPPPPPPTGVPDPIPIAPKWPDSVSEFNRTTADDTRPDDSETGGTHAFRLGRRGLARINLRKAVLTAVEVGNTFATSGSRSTMFVPSAYRFAYFPRTPPVKLISRSSGSGSSGRLRFVIRSSLCAGRRAGADDSDPVFVFHVRDRQQPTMR